MVKVSVIVPIFGVEKYIERCARSLFEQTLDDIEYIFVNDCTQDNSLTILNDIIQKYPNRNKVKIINHSENRGLPAARHTGLTNAEGEYIFHCDSDDWADVNMLKTLYLKAKEGDYDMVACDYFEYDGSNCREIKEILPEDKDHLTSFILSKQTYSAVWNKLLKRTVYDSAQIIFPTKNNAEDYATMAQLSLYICSYSIVHIPFYYYSSNPESITRVLSKENAVKRFEESCENINLTESFFKNHNLLKKYSKEFDYIRALEQRILLRFLNDPDVYDLWAKTSREYTYKPLFNRYFSIREKLRYYSVLFKIYPPMIKSKLSDCDK